MEKTRKVVNDITGEVRKYNVLNGGVSDEQVASWKKEYNKVFAIEVTDGDDLCIGYFHRPSMETISAVNKLAKVDEIKSSSSLFDNCWLGGEVTMKTDTLIRMTAIKQLGEMFNSVVGSLKNL